MQNNIHTKMEFHPKNWQGRSQSPFFADTIKHDDIELINYQSHPAIKAPLSN